MQIPWNPRYTLLLEAVVVTFIAVLIGWLIKRKFEKT